NEHSLLVSRSYVYWTILEVRNASFFVSFMPRRSPTSTLFPYTTLFRSDANPVYTDEAFAKASSKGSIIAPPAMLQAWSLEGFPIDRKSTRLNSSHVKISYAVFCLKKKKKR